MEVATKCIVRFYDEEITPLLTIGDQFTSSPLLIGGDPSKVDAKQPGDYFTTITSDEHPGKWRVVFFCRKTSRL